MSWRRAAQKPWISTAFVVSCPSDASPFSQPSRSVDGSVFALSSGGPMTRSAGGRTGNSSLAGMCSPPIGRSRKASAIACRALARISRRRTAFTPIQPSTFKFRGCRGSEPVRIAHLGPAWYRFAAEHGMQQRRTRGSGAARLAAIPAGAGPANKRSPVHVVVISSGSEGDQTVGSLDVKASGAGETWSDPSKGGEQPGRP